MYGPRQHSSPTSPSGTSSSVPGSRTRTSSSGESGVPTVVARAGRGAPGRVVRNRPSPIPNSCADHRPRRSSPSNSAGGTFAPDSTTCSNVRATASNAGWSGAPKWPCPSSTCVAPAAASSGSDSSRSAGPSTRAAPTLCGACTAQTMPALWITGMRCATRVPGVHPHDRAYSAALYQYSACRRGITLGTPVVPPESWNTATSSTPTSRWISSTTVRADVGSASGTGSSSTSTCRSVGCPDCCCAAKATRSNPRVPASTRWATAPTRRLISPISWPRCAASVHTGTSPALSTPYQATTDPTRLVTWNSTGSPGRRPRPARAAASRSEAASSSR